MSRYIITASEGTCRKLAEALAKHKVVEATFENSGFWYSNGETGPEWFTVTVEAEYKNKELVENLVQDELKKMKRKASNYYWG